MCVIHIKRYYTIASGETVGYAIHRVEYGKSHLFRYTELKICFKVGIKKKAEVSKAHMTHQG